MCIKGIINLQTWKVTCIRIPLWLNEQITIIFAVFFLRVSTRRNSSLSSTFISLRTALSRIILYLVRDVQILTGGGADSRAHDAHCCCCWWHHGLWSKQLLLTRGCWRGATIPPRGASAAVSGAVQRSYHGPLTTTGHGTRPAIDQIDSSLRS